MNLSSAHTRNKVQRGGVYVEGVLSLLVLLPILFLGAYMILALYDFARMSIRLEEIAYGIAVEAGTQVDGLPSANCADLATSAANSLLSHPYASYGGATFSIQAVGEITGGASNLPQLRMRGVVDTTLLGEMSKIVVIPVETKHNISGTCT